MEAKFEKVFGIEVEAAFWIENRWVWVKFTYEGGNKHAAIIDKAKELGATSWDYGNARVSPVKCINVRVRAA